MSGKDIDDIWEGDLLGRKDDGIYLQRFIENSYRMDTAHQNSFVLNINSEWGSGKTWFLERFAKQLKQNHPVVYFDAWKNDFTQDPLTSLIAVICQSMEEQFSSNTTAKQKVALVKKSALKFIKPSLPVVLAALVKHYSGVALLEETEEIESNSVASTDETLSIQDVSSSLTRIAASEAMKSFYKHKKGVDEFIDAVESFVAHLSSTGSDRHLPICIFIDELDRCRPTYAIELLEAVKHIFSIGGLFFVIATDSKQLAHSIKAVYGQDFNSTSYLKRFFYTEYSLSNVDYSSIASHLFSGFDFKNTLYLPKKILRQYGLDGYFALHSDLFELTPREQEQLFFNLKNCIISSDLNSIHFAYLLPLLCLKLKHSDTFETFKKNQDPSQLTRYFQEKGVESLTLGVTGMKHLQQEKHSQEPIDATPLDFISFYERNREGDFTKMKMKDFSFDFQIEIFEEMKKEMQINSDGIPINRHSISTYFVLISQAGKLLSIV